MTQRHVVTKDNGVMSPVLGDYNEAWIWLLKNQGFSTDFAMKHNGWAIKELPTPDEKDLRILERRQVQLLERDDSRPQVGDHVLFTDGTRRRVSHVWRNDEGWDGGIQTSNGGSYYMGDGYISMSGGLRGAIPSDQFSRIHGYRAAKVWFFHLDHHTAHNSVEALVDFRQWYCKQEAN